MSMLSMSISLTRCYQKLSPWLCTPLDQTSRAYLETHLDLLTDEYEQFLAIFVSQHENSPVDQQLLRTLQHLLRESRERGGTQQAVRDAYINVFGGLILDLPAWLARVEQQLEVVFSLAQTDRLVAENKMRLKEAISQAVREHLAPEIVAELQYQLGRLFANGVLQCSTGALKTAIGCYEASLRIYTPERYPLQYAKILAALDDVYC